MYTQSSVRRAVSRSGRALESAAQRALNQTCKQSKRAYLWAPRRRCRCPPPSPRQSHSCASFVKPRLRCHCLLRILRAELEGVHSHIQALRGNCTTYATRSSAAMNRKEQWYMDRSTVLYTPSQRRKPSLAKPVPVILELRRPEAQGGKSVV